MDTSKLKKANKAIRASIILNILLTIFKIFAGFMGKSSAMIADGFHTLSDIVSSIVVFFGLKVASKKADKKHPYGHERYELIFSKILSSLLIITGFIIGYEAFSSLSSGDYSKPGSIALIAALLSIIVKEIMFRFTIRTAKEINSLSLEADAWHHRSDVYSSIATFLGIVGARLGYPILDPILALIVAGLIVKVGIDIYMESISGLVDEAADKEMIENVKDCVNSISEIKEFKDLKTRKFGSKVYVDIDIMVRADMTVKEGHDIAKKLHDKVEEKYSDVKHIMVHVEPYEE